MTALAGPAAPGPQATDTQRPFQDAITAADTVVPPGPLQLPGLSGGRPRPAVSGVMTGLITSAGLVAGVTGGGASPHVIVLAGLAGLAAGALSAAFGQYAAVSARNELVRAQARKEGLELLLRPDAEEEELAEAFRSRGFGAELASAVARQVSADPVQALTVHLREEFGADHHHLPAPVATAAARLAAFAAGALIPLLPYLLGYASLAAALALAAVATLTGGALAARTAGRPALRGALRHLLLGAAAVAITYLIGHLAGGAV
jgi:vacuolar iron transporter family protein